MKIQVPLHNFLHLHLFIRLNKSSQLYDDQPSSYKSLYESVGSTIENYWADGEGKHQKITRTIKGGQSQGGQGT
jgi:hypothetical protein